MAEERDDEDGKDWQVEEKNLGLVGVDFDEKTFGAGKEIDSGDVKIEEFLGEEGSGGVDGWDV